MEKFMRLFHPIGALEESESLLFKYYVEQYGTKYRDLIRNNIDSTIYIFESTPDFTLKYLLQNEDKVESVQQLENVELEARDYAKLKSDLVNQRNRIWFSIFCYYHNISENEYASKFDSIINLINEIFDSFDKYSFNCLNIGVKPIEDLRIRNIFFGEVTRRKNEQKEALFLRSIWGQRMKKIFTDIGLEMDDSLLCKIFDLEYAEGKCLNHRCGLKFLYLPVIELYSSGICVDLAFLHENRHAVEGGLNSNIGIASGDGKYTMLNEVRTEKKAEIDYDNLPTIFSKKNFDSVVAYKNLYPFCEDFFEDYSYLFDMCAIENNIKLLEDVFGESELIEYDQLLTKIFIKLEESFRSKRGIKIICPYLDMIKKMRDNANKSKYVSKVMMKNL